MSIWFYLFLIVLGLSIFLILKILIIKNEIKNIGESLSRIVNTDTNNLITISTTDKDLRKLAKILNNSLKNLRKLELEYKNGNQDLKLSIANISHDLRTPLTAIRGYFDLIDVQNLTKKQKEYLKFIDMKVRDMSMLTEQLFDFSKSLDTFNKIYKKEVLVNGVLENVLCSLYDLFKRNKIEPVVDITDKKIIRMLDENMLIRILENIFSNAIKYGKGDVKVILNDEGVIMISNKVSNLDKTSVEKMFNRYYTVNNAKKSTGIGLSIAKQLVELNGGVIDANIENDILMIKLEF